MSATPGVAGRQVTAAETTYDAIIIGAGISGIHQLYRLRELSMKVRVFEAGTNVGGKYARRALLLRSLSAKHLRSRRPNHPRCARYLPSRRPKS